MYRKHNGGFIETITGCMFAGKTTELLRIIETLSYTNKTIIVFKPIIDTRYSKDHIVSHNGKKIQAINIKKANEIYKHDVEKYDIIIFDEANFLDNELIKIANKLAKEGKRVIVAGLDQDFRGQPFGPMTGILCSSEFVKKLKAVCVKCGDAGTMTQRVINGKEAFDDDPLILVDGKDGYESRCRKCHKIRYR